MGKKTYNHPRQYTTETFKERLKNVYGNRFGLDLIEYKGIYKPITLVCHKHGEFETRACNAAIGHANCKKCSAETKRLKYRIPFKEIIKRILDKHPNLIIDENQNYVNTHTKIVLKCPIHGEFNMSPNLLLNGQNCPKCGKERTKEKRRHDINWLINESNKINGDKYSFENFNYINTKTKGIVTCKKHGDFLITPEKLIYSKRGCPHCASSKLETNLKILLKQNKEDFIQQYNPKWLGLQRLDFYLPKYNVAIECQGLQHYEPVRFGGITEEKAKEQFEYVKNLDKRKKELCEKNGIKLLYLKYNENIDEFYKSLVNNK